MENVKMEPGESYCLDINERAAEDLNVNLNTTFDCKLEADTIFDSEESESTLRHDKKEEYVDVRDNKAFVGQVSVDKQKIWNRQDRMSTNILKVNSFELIDKPDYVKLEFTTEYESNRHQSSLGYIDEESTLKGSSQKDFIGEKIVCNKSDRKFDEALQKLDTISSDVKQEYQFNNSELLIDDGESNKLEDLVDDIRSLPEGLEDGEEKNWNKEDVIPPESCDFRSVQMDETNATSPENKDSSSTILQEILKPQKRHTCDLCSYSTNERSNLTRHVDNVHLKLKDQKCDLCSFVTTRKINLKHHINSIHLKLKCHKCELCDFSTTRKGSLKDHMNSVHLKMKNIFCQWCDYGTNRKAHLKLHVETVHLELKKHKCSFCDHCSAQKSTLDRHVQKVHLNLKIHQCGYCDYTTTLKYNLKNHVDSVHMKMRNHACHLCDYSSTRKINLNRHVNSVHLKVRNLKCTLCDYKAINQLILKRHVDNVHVK